MRNSKVKESIGYIECRVPHHQCRANSTWTLFTAMPTGTHISQCHRLGQLKFIIFVALLTGARHFASDRSIAFYLCRAQNVNHFYDSASMECENRFCGCHFSAKDAPACAISLTHTLTQLTHTHTHPFHHFSTLLIETGKNIFRGIRWCALCTMLSTDDATNPCQMGNILEYIYMFVERCARTETAK